MKLTYDLVVRSVDNRGRVRFEEPTLKEGEKSTNPSADVAFALSFEPDEKHGFTPGQRVKLSVEG